MNNNSNDRSNPSGNDDEDDNDDDRRFLRQFAAQIGAVLRQQEDEKEEEEEEEQQQARSSSLPRRGTSSRQQASTTKDDGDDAVYNLYRALVFDEPILDRISSRLDVVATTLGRKLLQNQQSQQQQQLSKSSSSTSYALSNRFINGILYMCHRTNNNNNNSGKDNTKKHSNDNNNNNNDTKNMAPGVEQPQQQPQSEESMSLSPTMITTTTATSMDVIMSKLAFVTLIEIPLQCCSCSCDSGDNSSSNKDDDGMLKIQRYLGTYKGNSTTNTDATTTTTTTVKDDTTPKPTSTTTAAVTATTSTADQQSPQQDDNNNNDDNDEDNRTTTSSSMKEIWAAESDPSDYDYGEGAEDVDGVGTNSVFQSQFWPTDDDEDWLDPKVLSRPDPTLTLMDAADAVATLLRLANYNVLEPIFTSIQSQKQYTEHVVSCLKQFSLLLLLQPYETTTTTTSTASIPATTTTIPEVLTQRGTDDHAILSPLWILRDAALYQSSQQQNNQHQQNQHQLVSDYMEVLQALLAFEQSHHDQNPNMNGDGTGLTTPSIVGLSSLSAWCLSFSSNKKNKNSNNAVTTITVNAIVDSMNDLSYLLERVEEISSTNDSAQAMTATTTATTTQQLRTRLVMTLVPILETLSAVWYDDIGRLPSSRNPIAQTLLNSGFLRQILVLASSPQSSSSPLLPSSEGSFDQQQQQNLKPLHHALWGLCIAYPTVVGKYVFRYPGTISIIRQYVLSSSSTALVRSQGHHSSSRDDSITADAQECVEGFLWNIFGLIQLSDNNTTNKPTMSKIVWKNKKSNGSEQSKTNTTTVPLTIDECSEVCQKTWSRLCQLVVDSLKELGVSPTNNDEAKVVLDEWKRLLVFARHPSISAKCVSMMDPECVETVFQTELATRDTETTTIRDGGQQATNGMTTTKKVKQEDNDDDNNDNAETTRTEYTTSASSGTTSNAAEAMKEKQKASTSYKEVIYGQAHRLVKDYRTFLRGGTTSKTD